MANFFATGHGLIGGFLKRQEDEGKLKKEREIVAEFLASNGGLDAPSIAAGFPSGQGGKTTVRTQPGLDEYARQLASPPASDESAGNINQRFNAMMRGEAQPAQPLASPELQQPRGAQSLARSAIAPANIPERSSISPSYINQQAAALIRKGIAPQMALQMVTSVYGQRKSEDAERQARAATPQLRATLVQAIKGSDRATALGAILQLQQYGVKVPHELFTWADRDKKHVQNDIGGQEINSAFNPATGQYSIGQVFNKTLSPGEASRNALGWANLANRQNGPGGGPTGGPSGESSVDASKLKKAHDYAMKLLNASVKKEDGSIDQEKNNTTFAPISGNDNLRILYGLYREAGLGPKEITKRIANLRAGNAQFQDVEEPY